uniref:Uncharacterized protein n=1 Tax=Setaria italica TaxID=4555 RepID=K3XU22_SETIT
MVARLNLLDGEITNDDSRRTAEARRMKDELEKKYNAMRIQRRGFKMQY